MVEKIIFSLLDAYIINSCIIKKKYGNDIKLQNFKFQLCTEILRKSFRKKKISIRINKEERLFREKRLVEV